jgi:hypothetical protein
MVGLLAGGGSTASSSAESGIVFKVYRGIAHSSDLGS